MTMKNARQLQRLFELLDAFREGTIRPEQMAELDRILSEDKKACRLYYEYFNMCALLRSGKAFEPTLAALPKLGDSLHDMAFWKAMAKEERTAPGIEIPAEPIPPQESHPAEQPIRNQTSVSRLSIASLLLSAAALIFVIAYAHFVSLRQGVETATLTDSLHAKWDQTLSTGARFLTGEDLWGLQEGYAELLFDNQVSVTLEGPAAFQIPSEDRLALRYGKVFVKVPKSATGFSVHTPNAKIIDLGTEFGVISNPSGETEVHVFVGKTILVGGTPKENKSVLHLAAGSAGKVSGSGASIREIQLAPNAFAQKINSRTEFVWKGEQALSLPTLLAGRLLTADPDGIEIDPASGRPVFHENYVSGGQRRGRLDFQPSDSPFLDGTFIPQGRPQIITSTGLTYSFPQTSGDLHFNLSDRKIVLDTKTAAYYPLFLDSASEEKPSLLMHPNLGITLDLDEIRRQIQPLRMTRFTAECGIAGSVRQALQKIYPNGNIPDDETPSVDFFVLLDGQAKQSFRGITMESGIRKIDVDIRPSDRFLTLAATDANKSIKYDWFVLSRPELRIAEPETEQNSRNPK